MIQQNDVLHWQHRKDTLLVLQLLFNHLHLHLSSLYLNSTQDLHRPFLPPSVSSFYSHLIPRPPHPSPLFWSRPRMCPTTFHLLYSNSSRPVPSFLLLQASPLWWHGLAIRCTALFSGAWIRSSVITIFWYRKGNFTCQLRYITLHVSHAPPPPPPIKNFHNKLTSTIFTMHDVWFSFEISVMVTVLSLPVSRLESDISRITAKVDISCRLDFPTIKFQIFSIVWATVNMECNPINSGMPL